MNGRSFIVQPLTAAAPSEWRALLVRVRQEAEKRRRPVLASRWEILPGETWSEADVLGFIDPFMSVGMAYLAPSQGLAMAGSGIAWHVSPAGAPALRDASAEWRTLASEAVVEGPERAQAPTGAGPILLGALPFDAVVPGEPEWAPLRQATLAVPRQLITVREGRAYRTWCAVVMPPGMRRPDCALTPLPKSLRDPRVPKDRPDRLNQEETGSPAERAKPREFRALVGDALTDIRSERLEKVVVARFEDVDLKSGPNVRRILADLVREGPDCTTFGVARSGTWFIGSTPERLATVEGRTVETMAVAGSAARGLSEGEDRALSHGLLGSTKDLYEHLVVVTAITKGLRASCSRVERPPAPGLLRLNGIQHLWTPIRGRLREGMGLLEVVADLHPTPAVAGDPGSRAVEWIRQHEGWDRGLYGGPLGYVDAKGQGTFVVALRCGLLSLAEEARDRSWARLFAGSGIVAGSEPEREWQETELKLRTMRRVLERTPQEARA